MRTFYWPVLLAACSFTAQLPKLGSSSSSPSAPPPPPSSSAPASPAAATPVESSPAVVSNSEDCEKYPSISDEKLEPLVALMRCPNSTPASNSDTIGEYGRARAWLRGGLDNSLVDPPNHLLRAVYVHLCARQLREDNRPFPAMAIGCAWQADRVDLAGLDKELASRPAAHRSTIARQAAADIRTVRERALAAFPKAKAAREWEIFYDLPTRVRNQALARRSSNQAVFQRLVAFETAVQAGKLDGCVPALRDTLTTYLHGAKTLPAITERITDPVGYALADALARCHYYNENGLKAGALLTLLAKARRQVTVAEQINFAQIDALAGDAEKAEKFPNLVGTKYSSVHPTDLRPASPWSTPLEDKWQQHKGELVRFQTRDGRVARLDKAKGGTMIYLQKERVPLVDVRCHETNRIDSITREGKIVYREVCTSTPKGMTWSSPSPVTVDDARGITPGRFVRIATDGDRGVVLSSASGPEETAQINRIADLVLGS